MTPLQPALSPQVQAVLTRARDIAADGKTSTHEMSQLVGDIGRLSEPDRKALFDTFDGMKQQAGAPKEKEALEVFLGALKESPAMMIAKLERDDGVVDIKDALAVLASIGKGHVTKNDRMSVFASMLISKASPDAQETLQAFATNRPINIDGIIRALEKRGNVTVDEVRALKTGAGTDPYQCYQLSYWAQTSDPKCFAPGGFEALRAAAEETYAHVSTNYRTDLELNRGRPVSTRGAHVLNVFSRETLKLPYGVSFNDGRYDVELGGGHKKTFAKPDDLGAFLIEDALKRAGHNIDSVRFDPAEGGRYVLTKGNAEERKVFHTEILRQFGYAV